MSFFFGKGSMTDMGERYPLLDRHHESNIPGLYVIGNIAGTPDVKAALNAGFDTARHIADMVLRRTAATDIRVVIIGAGPAGVNAALELGKRGVRYVLIEAESRFAAIKRCEPEHAFYLARTGDRDICGDLWFGDCKAGELVRRWEDDLKSRSLELREHEKVVDVKKIDHFEVVTDKGRYRSEFVIVAVGKLVLLNRLDVAELQPIPPGKVSRSMVEGTGMPSEFLKKAGIRLENTWDWKRWTALSLTAIGVFAFYMIKKLHPGWFHFGGRDLAGWYPFLYSALVLYFGIKAIRRYRDPLQTRKYLSLIFFQLAFYSIIPELILNNWRAYGLVYAWPLALGPSTWEGFLQEPGKFYFWWTLGMSFLVLPIFVLFTGKQYCSWVCGCGGLAETVGDQWRHYSPKGPENVRRERAIYWILGFAAFATLAVGFGIDARMGGWIKGTYNWVVDLFLIAIIPISLYPFLGGKVWCRYWCPTAGFMQLLSGWMTRRGIGKYRIDSNKDRCIACNMCSRCCEVGIDVRKFALKGESFDNLSTSCIGCGICISVCPTGALAFSLSALGGKATAGIRATWVDQFPKGASFDV